MRTCLTTFAGTLSAAIKIHGKASVVETCTRSAAFLSQLDTEFLELRCTRSENRVVVETLAKYVEDAGASQSVVASCDIYDFENEKLCLITSYNIELSEQKPDA